MARAYQKVLSLAHSLVYLEDQYFWNVEVVQGFADALRRSPNLRLIVVLPRFPDQDGRVSEPPNLLGRRDAMALVRAAGGSRVGIYGIENHDGTPVYVHAKVCVVDDVWASVGSDNVNLRSWTHDSELACAVFDQVLDHREPQMLDDLGSGARQFARALRLGLSREHLDRPTDSVDELCDPVRAFDAFAASAARLDRWYSGGCQGARPSGRLRAYPTPKLSRSTVTWARPVYRAMFDPDGRGRKLRRARGF